MGISQKQVTTGKPRNENELQFRRNEQRHKLDQMKRREELNKLYPNNTVNNG